MLNSHDCHFKHPRELEIRSTTSFLRQKVSSWGSLFGKTFCCILSQLCKECSNRQSHLDQVCAALNRKLKVMSLHNSAITFEMLDLNLRFIILAFFTRALLYHRSGSQAQ